MTRKRRPRSGPDSVWRILRRLAREARRNEEWRRRFEVEERARERAFRRRLRSEEAAWRARMEEERRVREAKEAARREAAAKAEQDREARAAARETEEAGREAAWREKLRKDREQRKAREAAWRQQMELEEKKREAEEAAREAAYKAERKQAERRLDRAIHRMIGDGDERFGRLMEALTEGDLPPLLQRAGYPVLDDGITKRQGVSNVAEFDLTAKGEEVTVVVEVKTTLRPEDVRWFVKKMERYREWFSASAPGALHGAMAYLTATETAPKMATRRGLLLIRVVGSSASIVSPPGFEPRNF